ncbi:MAG: thiosulfate oxidation carrier protein SoxY, partial [Pseudomonadota bacterium]
MKTVVTALALLGATALSAEASNATWDSLSAQIYPGRAMLDGSEIISIDAPYRTYDDARTQIAAEIAAPQGLNIGKVTLVLDENPMPVSAVFTLDQPQPRFFFDVTMRVNGPTPLHVVVETTDSRLWVAETYVKTSGLGACSAPPGTDPKLALANLGQMQIEISGGVPGVQGL